MIDPLLYRFVIIPQTRRALLQLQRRDAWMTRESGLGPRPHRSVQPGEVHDARSSRSTPPSATPTWCRSGTSRPHEGYAYHWDGLNTTLQEVVLSSAIGDGATMKWVDRDYAQMERHRSEADVEPAAHPELHQQACSRRRIRSRSTRRWRPKARTVYAGAVRVVPRVRRQPHRHDHSGGGGRHRSPSPRNVDAGVGRRLQRLRRRPRVEVLALQDDRRLRRRCRSTASGCARRTCTTDRCRRSPHLLEPVDQRPTRFWRGYDVFDPVRVGFVSDGPEAERIGTRYDTSRPGNSNAGHTYGVSLSAQSKRALLEFLKTL